MQREQILDAAFDILPQDGPPKPARVALQAGVSKALVFHHFRTVEGLHDAMAERVLRDTQRGLDALAEEHQAARDRLDALARALLVEPPETPAVAANVLRFWLGDDGRGGSRGGLRDALVTDFVAKTLKGSRSNVDPRGVASMLLARWHGATLVYASGGAVDFDAEAERTLRELDVLLR